MISTAKSPVDQIIGQLRNEEFPTFQYLVENSLDAILMTDADLQIVYANHACHQLIGRTVTAQPLHSLWPAADRPILEGIIEAARTGSFFSRARLNGFYRVISRYPNLEIVGRLGGDWDREKGRKAAEKFLRANPPGTLDLIWTASGEMALGALQAVEAAGRQAEVQIFSNDVTPESVAHLLAGRLLAETHHGFADWGWYGAQFGVLLALGKPAPPVYDIRPRTVYKGNAHHFYPAPTLEPIDWAAIKAGCQLPEQITIGWIQAAATGVYNTATAYFEKAAAEARQHGIPLQIRTRILAAPDDFVGKAAIIEEYIDQGVDVIAFSTVKVEVIRRAIAKANAAGIPVIVVNQLEPIEDVAVASYIGFDNTVAGAISGYAVVDYLGGGPGVLGRGERIGTSQNWRHSATLVSEWHRKRGGQLLRLNL